jgi:D-alanine-D-alanine ligase
MSDSMRALDTSLRVTVVYGGPSEEREISIESGTAIAGGLRSKGFRVHELELAGTIDAHLDDLRASSDVVFIALHGRYGEDGAIQSALDAAGIAYTGCGPQASRTGMEKSSSKRIFEAAGIDTPKYRVIGRSNCGSAADELRSAGLGFPMVVKPDASGSSIGVSIVEDEGALREALREALKYGESAIVEERVIGRELTVGVLGDRALPVLELTSTREFFDYSAKYSDGYTTIECPARLGEQTSERTRAAAIEAFKAVGGRDFARVDFMLDEHNTPMALEINTIPGFTAHSLLPHAAKVSGIGFGDLVAEIVMMAAERRGSS